MISHNVNKLNLLRNEQVYFITNEDKKINFFLPSFRDYLEDTDLTLFFSARDMD